MARKSVIDRKALYFPQPQKWNWDKLSDIEIGSRLNTARDSLNRLIVWREAVEAERKAALKELWARLPSAKLRQYSKTRGWTLEGGFEIEDMGKELKELGRLYVQMRTAIEDIEAHAAALPVGEKASA